MTDEKTAAMLVQKLFSYPEGPHVLDWLEEVYQQYLFKHIIQSESRNAHLAMAYKAGQSDVVTTLREIVIHGFKAQRIKHQEEGELEYAGRYPETGSESSDDTDPADTKGVDESDEF